MKATKALRRLAKIEASMSDVVERYVSLAPAVRKALLSLEVSSETADDSPVMEPPEPPSKAIPRELRRQSES